MAKTLRPALLVGLTGGIGSGKSEVGRLFEKLGVRVVDADQVAREVVEPGQPALVRIVEHFGPEVLVSDQTLNRRRLRSEEHTSELQSRGHLVCRLLLENKKDDA